MRVAFLTNIISPYRRPVFERLSETSGWQMRFFVNAETEFDRTWTVDTSRLDVVQSRSARVRRPVISWKPVFFLQWITLHLPVGLWFDLRNFRPEVLVSHELGPRTLIAAVYAWLRRVPLVIWSYQSRISATQGSGLRDVFRRWLLRRADIVVGMGTQTREVLKLWGVEDERIVDAPNTADTDSIGPRLIDPAAESRRSAIQERFSPGRRMALVVGRLIGMKGISRLLDGWSRLDESVRDEWRLVFVGNGPLASEIRSASGDGVVLAGPVEASEMPDWYAASDLHIFPSLGDVWGLVVNEAMECGTPSLCSVHAGCCDDLVQHSIDGLRFDPSDPESMLADLGNALRRRDLSRLGEAARKAVVAFTPERMAVGFRTAVSRACVARGGVHEAPSRTGGLAS